MIDHYVRITTADVLHVLAMVALMCWLAYRLGRLRARD